MKRSCLITVIFFSLAVCLFGNQLHADDLDPYGGFTDVKGEKTGFFHTQRIDNR